jgi:hypothetical protein
MPLYVASLLPGLLLIALGLPLALDLGAAKAALRGFPRSRLAGNLVFGAASVWFLYNILHLSDADFGEYRYFLFAGFGAVAVLSFKCVPDFLGVRGASALVLIGASPFLQSAYMEYDHPARLFMVSFVYVALALAIWLGVQPWRLRDFFSWLFTSPLRSRGLGALMFAYGVVLCGAAYVLR